jgi:hypothetical protein
MCVQCSSETLPVATSSLENLALHSGAVCEGLNYIATMRQAVPLVAGVGLPGGPQNSSGNSARTPSPLMTR